MHKLSQFQDEAWVEHTHAREYALPEAASPVPRLEAGVPGGDPGVFERLALEMRAPYLLLCVLHTPRGEAEPGRYESPELTREQVQALVARFGAFLSADARFDLWAHSPSDGATVVWDRHNVIYAYGVLDRFAAALEELGFRAGKVTVPVPHQHHYRPECDALAAELLRGRAWTRSPLHPEDEQFPQRPEPQ